MPATAWEVIAGFLTSPVDATMCFEPPDGGMLEDAERRVPGTAGFVARFLDTLGPTTDSLDAAAAIHDAARELSAPYGAEIDAVWTRIEERRQAGGTFEPWSIRRVRDHIETHRAHLWHSERVWEKAISVVYLPGFAVAAVVGLQRQRTTGAGRVRRPRGADLRSPPQASPSPQSLTCSGHRRAPTTGTSLANTPSS